MTFSEVIGQQGVAQWLTQMADEQRLPHALMFCGPAGSGKMALALALASYVLGDSPMIRRWQHPDLHFVYPVVRPAGAGSDAKITSDDYGRQWRDLLASGPYFTLDQWLQQMDVANQQAMIFEAESEAIMRKLSLKSSQGGYKIAVIWLPERMNTVCANKILKLLEEPPRQTLFLLVSEEPAKLLETIRSRVQRIDIRRIDETDIERALVDRRGIDAANARRIAHFANGSWLRALDSLGTDSEDSQLLEMYKQLMRLAYARNVRELKKWSETAAAFGREKQKRMLAYFGRMTRENFMYNFHEPSLCYMTADEDAFATKFARFIHEANVIVMADAFEKAGREISQNVSPKIIFFDLALNMIMMLLRR